MSKRLQLLLFAIMAVTAMYGQDPTGTIQGIVIDGKSKDPIEDVLIEVKQQGDIRKTGKTDAEGKYSIPGLRTGTYNVVFKKAGYAIYIERGFDVNEGVISVLNPSMADSTIRTGAVSISKAKPVATRVRVIGGTQNSGRDVVSISNTSSRVQSINGSAPTFSGARSNATAYFIDGVRITGTTNISQGILDNVQIIAGGVSAEYGDFIGGAISSFTTLPSNKFRASVEGITSSLFDKYHYNLLEAKMVGPLYIKDKDRGDKERVVLGYTLLGNYTYSADRSPSAIGVWKVKDEKLKELEQNPIRKSPIGEGYVPAAEFVTANDLEKVKANLNVPINTIQLFGNLNWVPTKDNKTQLLFALKYDHVDAINYGFQNNLFNYNNNSQSISDFVLSYLQFKQTLIDPNDSAVKAAVKKNPNKVSYLGYTVRAEYESNWGKSQDAVHKDNTFDYGYIGKLNTYSTPNYVYRAKGDGEAKDSFYYNDHWYYLGNYYLQSGNRLIDTAVRFDRSTTRNPVLSNYTSRYFDLRENNVNSITEIRGSNAGLISGQNPIGIYSQMWNNVGASPTGYSKSQSEKYSLNASSEIKAGKHNIKFGVYYEQRVSRAYAVGAFGLWQLMYQLANNGIVLDTANPHLVFDEKGIFRDTVKYDFVQNSNQSNFDKNLRKSLMESGARDVNGNPVTNASFIDIYGMDPSQFSLSMFSADELLNNGNSLVTYYGYDYLGNKVRGRKSYDDFLNSNSRSIGAYTPVYTAAYVQDQFFYKDLTFRLGVRVERFDNNMPVLKDPYSLYPLKTAGEVRANGFGSGGIVLPSSIGDNYAVYVNDGKNPTSVIGFRDGNTWYNKEGLQIADPSVLQDLNRKGILEPYLVDPNQQEITSASFTDFEPVINVLPRLLIDFPISTTSRFFASYDVLAQRPSNSLTNIDDYYFLKYNPTLTLNNPNLKSQLSTDYELGFKQAVSYNSSLSFFATYREQRNLIQLYRYNFAYPQSYTSFGNIDFSTVKAFRVEYDLMRAAKGALDVNASYTLQYADGTGSNAGSQQALVSAGQPNLRNLFPLDIDVRHNVKLNVYLEFKGKANGEEYDGPLLGKKKRKTLEDAGIALNLNAVSGTPYTSNLIATPNVQAGQVVRSPIKGTPFGSRLPWQMYNDVKIYKWKAVSFGKNSKGIEKMGRIRFELWVQNFLNIKNVVGVHPYTGSPSTDGWLSSPTGRASISSATNAQSYVDLYNTALNNPGYYSLPRRARFGVKLEF